MDVVGPLVEGPDTAAVLPRPTRHQTYPDCPPAPPYSSTPDVLDFLIYCFRLMRFPSICFDTAQCTPLQPPHTSAFPRFRIFGARLSFDQKGLLRSVFKLFK